MKINYSKEVKEAQNNGVPVLALESTIIAHGMPYPDNYEFAKNAEATCHKYGVVPATVAIINGSVLVGLDESQLESLASDTSYKKISKREIGLALAQNWNGATTVSATMHIAHKAGINVFATGGIGGVHRGVKYSFDVSQDLVALAQIPIIVVSAGAKTILDLPKTVELLETLGVVVLGYETNEFPAFYSRSSGVYGIHSVNNTIDIANIYNKNKSGGLTCGTLVVNPIPKSKEIPIIQLSSIIQTAYEKASRYDIEGNKLTPFLLNEISERTIGKSLEANKALALNNIKLGAKIAKNLS